MRYFEDHPVLAHDILEMMSSGVAVIDDEGIIGDLNQRAADMTGYAVDDLVGQDVQNIVPNFRRESQLFTCRDDAAKMKDLHTWLDREIEVRRRDGSLMRVDFSCSRLVRDGQSWTVVSISENTVKSSEKEGVLGAE